VGFLLTLSAPASAGIDHCNARLSQAVLLSADSLYKPEFAKLNEAYSDVRVTVGWGDFFPLQSTFGSAWRPNRTIFPTFPKPGVSQSGMLYVMVKGQLIVPRSGAVLPFDLEFQKFQIRTIEMMRQPRAGVIYQERDQEIRPAHLIGLYAALATVPYAEVLIVTQDVDPKILRERALLSISPDTIALGLESPMVLKLIKEETDSFRYLGAKVESASLGYYFRIVKSQRE